MRYRFEQIRSAERSADRRFLGVPAAMAMTLAAVLTAFAVLGAAKLALIVPRGSPRDNDGRRELAGGHGPREGDHERVSRSVCDRSSLLPTPPSTRTAGRGRPQGAAARWTRLPSRTSDTARRRACIGLLGFRVGRRRCSRGGCTVSATQGRPACRPGCGAPFRSRRGGGRPSRCECAWIPAGYRVGMGIDVGGCAYHGGGIGRVPPQHEDRQGVPDPSRESRHQG